ncbi:MAG TPA: 16S rRNA (guanine(966)-N(2))-methyltransferase RsmD [Conexibacter sp.]|nr:16S rRNA (guanine(966)-N(2))-methyltransferase RsmD [Conexibacter sp.]
MRIVAGRYGGRRLTAPPGSATRPTSDRVREALFQRLGALDEARVLDLFAGSGALGLEALSRGASHATLVDSAPAAIKVMKANVGALALSPHEVEVRKQDARAFLRGARAAGREYDLVLLDPPYRLAAELGRELSPLIAAVLAPGGRVVSESDRRAPLDLDSDLPLTDERRYGDTLIRTHERTE